MNSPKVVKCGMDKYGPVLVHSTMHPPKKVSKNIIANVVGGAIN